MAKNDWIGHADRKGAHYSKNWGPDKQKEYMKNYYRTHPEKWRSIEQAGRAADAAQARTKQAAQEAYDSVDDYETPRFDNAIAKGERATIDYANAAARFHNATDQVAKDSRSQKGRSETAQRMVKETGEKAAKAVKRAGKKIRTAGDKQLQKQANLNKKMQSGAEKIQKAQDNYTKSVKKNHETMKKNASDLVARGGDIINNIVGSFGKKKGKKKK